MSSPVLRRSDWQRRLATPGVGLLPLRVFLGATFVYAGLQKLADRNFFRSSRPSSIQAQLHAYAHQSPVGGLLAGATRYAVIVGLLIALAELVVGAGTLLGLWARPAAIGGALLSLGFLLTVSWHSRPYYYGADIVFLFAWLPLVIVGDGGVLSLSARLHDEARRTLGVPVLGPVNIEFDTVRSLCGAFEAGACRFRKGKPCEPTPCPVLRTGPRPASTLVESLDRRAFLVTARTAAYVAAGVAGLGGVAAIVGRLVPVDTRTRSRQGALPTPSLNGAPRKTATTPSSTRPTPPATTTGGSGGSAPPPSPTPVTVRPRGTAIGAASSVSKGGAASFVDPATGAPAYVVRSSSGDYRAFNAVCTHAGCTVQYAGLEFVCPCHGARFSTSDGSATRGPAQSPLASIPLNLGPDGQLYAHA